MGMRVVCRSQSDKEFSSNASTSRVLQERSDSDNALKELELSLKSQHGWLTHSIPIISLFGGPTNC